MKKIVLLLSLLILTGCRKEKVIITDTLTINYKNNNLVKSDFKEITNDISLLNFSCTKELKNIEDTITITTNRNVYKISISNNYYMEIQNNNKYCYTKESEKVKKIVNKLEETIKKYQDISYFTIRSEKNYNLNELDTFVKLDKSNDFIIINSIYPLYDFRINQIEYDGDSYKEISPLYSVEKINQDINMVIRKEIFEKPDFKISFKNEYNYLINILPIINENKEINFITDIKK